MNPFINIEEKRENKLQKLRNERYALERKYLETQKRVREKTLAHFPAIIWALNHHVNTRSEKMNFNDLHYLLQLYKVIDKNILMCVEKSVQCGLSELFIIQSHIEAGQLGMTVMYVLPKYELRNRFVDNRIFKLQKKVPKYNYLLKQAETSVQRKSLIHFGRGTLAFVGSNVESEFIEIPVDSAYVDEKDRCNQANLLLVPDRLTASPYKFQREISNPTVEGFGIDERYLQSSQALWNIKCPHCNKYFSPDFFRHVVREVAHNVYEARDPDYVPYENEARLIHDCGEPMNRLEKGMWIHKYPKRDWKGYRISKVYSKFARLSELIETWQDALGNELKTQVFYNSNLGLPYSSKGAKITVGMLNECRRRYRWPVVQSRPESVRLMGVDVGEVLHVIIRERVFHDGVKELKLILAANVPGFSQVSQLIREWKPKRVVVDAQPEIHKVMELKDKFKMTYSSRFQNRLTKMNVEKKSRSVSMDRTAILDFVKAAVENQVLWLPMKAEFIDDGQYYSQMTASTRILEANQDNPEKSRYVWVHTKPDHYFLAEAYCLQADMLMPQHDIFTFYESEAEAMKGREARKIDKEKQDEREKIAELQKLTPHLALEKIRSQYQQEKKVKPKVDDKAIYFAILDMYKTQGYADLVLIAQQTSEHEGDVLRILKQNGFSESRIKGQYVK
jgi:hypothetical protein